MNKENVKENINVNEKDNNEDVQYSLNDDRRVKVLSPGALVAKRFFRNRIAVVGLSILVIMFLFSFVGGMISPYGEKDFFYRYEIQTKQIAGAKENTEYRYVVNDETLFDVMAKAKTSLAINTKATSFSYNNLTYTVENCGTSYYVVSVNGKVVGYAAKDIMYFDDDTSAFDIKYNLMNLYKSESSESYTYNGKVYTVSAEGGIFCDGTEIGYISTYIVNAIETGTVFTKNFKEELQEFLVSNDEAGNFKRDGENEKVVFNYTDPETKETTEYVVAYNAADERWVIKIEKSTYVYDTYSAPSKEHLLGTDSNGMDMLTRLMYGGRVSLVIGFIVVFLEIGIGVIFGGLAGFFGGWVDYLIMRIVDIMYCIPSTPILIIIGAAMDAMGIDPTIRMVYLMLILGFLGWPGIAHMVRGQILSLREQEFMTACEATGLSTYRRIFKHLIPNVIPQLIVSGTMGLGSAILTEATLSFLGLGVRFPFASWGNIINDVNNTFVLTSYWWVWIPAGCCILLTVLAFNLVGDGLRDAFDPKMKR